MKTKFITIALLFCSIMVANAVEYRTKTVVVATSTPQYPECNEVYRVVEEKDPYLPNVWYPVSSTLIETTCNPD